MRSYVEASALGDRPEGWSAPTSSPFMDHYGHKGALYLEKFGQLYFGELLVRNFGGEWFPGHALGPAVRVVTPDRGARNLFPLGWVYRRADGGEAESIAAKLHRELGYPDPADLGRFTDSGERA